MKITRKQLKRIIKEEMQRTLLTEAIEISENTYPNIWEHIVIPLQCEIVRAYSKFDVTCGANGPADADWVNADNNELHHRNEVIKFDIPAAVWPNNQAELNDFLEFGNVDYPNGLELTLFASDPKTQGVITNIVSSSDLSDLVGKDSDAADELKALARELVSPPDRVGSFSLQITRSGGYEQVSRQDH
jgi:hypothetical protein